MTSRKGAAALALAALAIAVGLFVALRDTDEGNPTGPAETSTKERATAERNRGAERKRPEEPRIATIEVRDGEPVGGVRELSFPAGGTIEFEVVADMPEEAHLHGYDVSQEVGPGRAARFAVPADIEGAFELELEHAGVPIAEIRVEPD